ncbi:MAG: hypothetical protein K2J90_13570 [Lachnospiraceae bacterium]|nr:hypothetical protein [Lachnospiraceae bacterium]
MADIITKIIPVKYDYIADEEQTQAAIMYIKEIVPDCQIEAEVFETTQFVDCGGELEVIKCPDCGEDISFGWWGEVMEKAAEKEFSDLSVKLLCCGRDSSLNDLEYYLPCGYARMEITIANLERKFSEKELVNIGELLGEKVRIILARY